MAKVGQFLVAIDNGEAVTEAIELLRVDRGTTMPRSSKVVHDGAMRHWIATWEARRSWGNMCSPRIFLHLKTWSYEQLEWKVIDAAPVRNVQDDGRAVRRC